MDIRYEISGFTVLFTSRIGGVSGAPYDEKNLAFHVGDEPNAVRENRRRALEALGAQGSRLTCGQQVHGTGVKVVNEEDVGMGALDYESAHPDTDALITNLSGVPLAVFTADCVPIVMCDRGRKATAVAHAGWRGTIEGVQTATLEALRDTFGTDPDDLEVFIGPHIRSCCFSVGEALAERFAHAFSHEVVSIRDENGLDVPYLDLRAANILALKRSGIRSERIEKSEICTSCTNDRFFSYRKEQVTGRQAGMVIIRG